MTTTNEKQQAAGLRKEKKYDEALPIYETLWSSQENRDPWDGWGYALCLRKTGRTKEALDVCREAFQSDPGHRFVRQLYAQCIYDLEIAPEEIRNISRFLKAANGILRLVDQSDTYAPFTSTIFKVCHHMKQRNQMEEVLSWLDRLNKEVLSPEPRVIAGAEGKEIRVLSDLEHYYSYRAKALYELGEYDACLSCVEEALSSVREFVNDGDLWLLRLRALSLAGKRELEPALSQLKELLHRKNVWFIHQDLAELSCQNGDPQAAWVHLLKALLDRSPVDMRINVFDRAAEWFVRDGNLEEGRECLELVLSIRKEHGWPIKSPLITRAAGLKLDLEQVRPTRDLLKSLRPQWQQELDRLEPRLTGVIDRLIAEGRAGFVKTPDGAQYFFQSRFFRGQNPTPGQSVTFRTEPGYDSKKQKNTTNAVDIRPE